MKQFLRLVVAAGITLGLSAGTVGVATAATTHAAPKAVGTKPPKPKKLPVAGQFCSKSKAGTTAIGKGGGTLTCRKSGKNRYRWVKA